jgi:hypothetical protein
LIEVNCDTKSDRRRKSTAIDFDTLLTARSWPDVVTLEPRCVVFVVDDDASIRDALCTLIRSVGLVVQALHQRLNSSLPRSRM